MLELAHKGTLITDDSRHPIISAPNTPQPDNASNPSGGRYPRLLGREPTLIHVPLLIRPWVVQGFHTDMSCHLGWTRTLQILEGYYWWVGVESCTRWLVRPCLKRLARKTSHNSIRWPIISMPLPNGSGELVSFDHFGPLSTTARGHSCILRTSYRFSRHSVMHTAFNAEFTAEGGASMLVEQFIPVWGCPSKVPSDNEEHFCAELSLAVCKLLGTRKLLTLFPLPE